MKERKLFGLALVTFFLISSLVLLAGCPGDDNNGGAVSGGGNTVIFTAKPTGGTLIVELGPVKIPTGTKVPEGTMLKFTAIPDEGYKFVQFIIDGADFAGNAVITCTMPATSINIMAIFGPRDPDEFIITFSAEPKAGGYFTGTAGNDAITFMMGKKNIPVTFKVTADEEYELVTVKYKLGSGGADIGTITASGGIFSLARNTADDILVTAYFEKLPAKNDISLVPVPSGGGDIGADKTLTAIIEGTIVNITATPASANEYGFIKFQVNNVDILPELITANSNGSFTYTLSMPDTAAVVKAYFGINVTLNHYEGKTEKIVVMEGSALNRPSPDPWRGLHTFNNWYSAGEGGDVVDFPLIVNAPVTIYAQWTQMSLNRNDYDIYHHNQYTWAPPNSYNCQFNYRLFEEQAKSKPGSRILMFINPRSRTATTENSGNTNPLNIGRIFAINPWTAPLIRIYYTDLAPLPDGITAADVLPEDVVGSTAARGSSWDNCTDNEATGIHNFPDRNNILETDLNNVMVLDVLNLPQWVNWDYWGGGNARDHELEGITIIRIETWVPKS